MATTNKENNRDNRGNNFKTVVCLLAAIIGGFFLITVLGEIPKLFSWDLLTSIVPSAKIFFAYIYIAVIAFIAGRYTKK